MAFLTRSLMKGLFNKDKESEVDSTTNGLPENALVWAGLLREG